MSGTRWRAGSSVARAARSSRAVLGICRPAREFRATPDGSIRGVIPVDRVVVHDACQGSAAARAAAGRVFRPRPPAGPRKRGTL